MNTVILNALNGYATLAKAANDENAISILQEVVQRLEYGLGTTYDAATATAAPYIFVYPNFPAGSIAPSEDSALAVNATLKQAGG